MTKKVSLGLIGLGQIGKVHLQNCLHLETAKLVAVSDISRKALSFAKSMGVNNSSSDYQKLLEDRSIDAVIIALPTYLHASCVQSAAEAGKDILVEKPLARNVAEGKEIVSTATRNSVKLMVGYDMRFSSTFRSLKEKMQNGILGEVQIAYGTNVGSGPFFHRGEGGIPRPVPPWWFKKELTGGGAVMDLGCHLVNLFRWYFGEVTNIKSYLGYRFNMDFEDQATCIAQFTSGPIAVINVGWFSQKRKLEVELFGTVKHTLAGHAPQNRIITAIKRLAGISSQFYSPFFRELEHFVHCVRNDLQPSPSGNDALKDLETISLAYKNEIVLKEGQRY